MNLPERTEQAAEETAIANRKSGEPSGNDEWQFSLRSLFILVTAWALFLSITATVPGLGSVPYVIGFIAVIGSICFGVGCFAGWLSKR